MQKKWRLLSDEEINTLSSEDLEEYISWVKKYKKEKLQEIYERNSFLTKASEIKDREELKERNTEDKNKISQIKAALRNK